MNETISRSHAVRLIAVLAVLIPILYGASVLAAESLIRLSGKVKASQPRRVTFLPAISSWASPLTGGGGAIQAGTFPKTGGFCRLCGGRAPC